MLPIKTFLTEILQTRCIGTASKSSSGNSSRKSSVASCRRCRRATRRARRVHRCQVAGVVVRLRRSATGAECRRFATLTRTLSSAMVEHCHPPASQQPHVIHYVTPLLSPLRLWSWPVIVQPAVLNDIQAVLCWLWCHMRTRRRGLVFNVHKRFIIDLL